MFRKRRDANMSREELDAVRRETGLSVDSIEALKVNVETGGRLLGFGKRVVVPIDQIHVVGASGFHIARLNPEELVFGGAAGRPSVYWLNDLTQVVGISTLMFVVPVSGEANLGVTVLDKNRVQYQVSAHVIAVLNVSQAQVAARRVGPNLGVLVQAIEEATEAELSDSAAQLSLIDVIRNKQQLAESATEGVNKALSELGYELKLLKISTLSGDAYQRLVEQAETQVVSDTTVEINTINLKTAGSDNEFKRQQSLLDAETRHTTEQRRLEADKQVAALELDKQETVAQRQHELALQNANRQRGAAEADQSVKLREVELGREVQQRELVLDQQLALEKAAKEAEVKAVELEKQKALQLAETEADAARKAVEQQKQLALQMEAAEAEAERLQRVESARADREKLVKVTQAMAEAEALRTKVDAETQAELTRATADADAAKVEASAEKVRAEAAKVRAEAQRAEASAGGLAQADVEAERVKIAERQVKVTRDDGLAKAEIAQKEAEAEIARQQGLERVRIEAEQALAELYQTQPALLQIRQDEMRYAHDERVAQIQAEQARMIATAFAEKMDIRVHLIGGGSNQLTGLIQQLMHLGQGLNVLGETVPAVQRIMDNVGMPKSENGTGSGDTTGTTIPAAFAGLAPFIQEVLKDMKPRLLSSLTVEDLANRVQAVISGRDDLLTALDGIRKDARFQMVSGLPVSPLLKWLGLTPGGDDSDLVVIESEETKN